MFRRTLVAGWKDAHRWASMRFKAVAAALAGIQAAWPSIPAGYKSALPPSIPHYLAMATVASVGLAAYCQITQRKS